jgi:hypothetical protein
MYDSIQWELGPNIKALALKQSTGVDLRTLTLKVVNVLVGSDPATKSNVPMLTLVIDAEYICPDCHRNPHAGLCPNNPNRD